MRDTIKIRDLSNAEVRDLAWAIDNYGYPEEAIGNSDWKKAALILANSVCRNYEVKPNNDDLEPSDYVERLVEARYGLNFIKCFDGGASLYEVADETCCKALAGGKYFIWSENVSDGNTEWGTKVTITNVKTGKGAIYYLAYEDDFCATQSESYMSMIAEMELGDKFKLEDFTCCREGYLNSNPYGWENHKRVY